MNEIQYIKTNNILKDARFIIETARSNAVHSVDFCRVQMYWNLGRRILEEEQQGNERAEYGTYIIKNLADRLESDYGSGFGKRQLERARQFFLTYPIATALRSQLNWSQYRRLIQIPDPDKREYYELESVNNAWNGRELERQINSHLYERLMLSNDKETLLAIARKERIPETPQEIIKDPMVPEFGKGFSFVARQKRILLEDDEFFIDLVFYNRLMRCFVLVELKTGKLTHQDLGQLQMYVNYYDRNEKLEEENPTIGILLCSSKNDTVVKMTLPEQNKTILASKYELYMPTSEQLVKKIEEAKIIIDNERR